MDVFSEIEIEALVEEAYVSESAEVLGTGDVVAQEVELEALTTFLDGQQSFDPFAAEWLSNEENSSLAIDTNAVEWLAAFVQDGAIIADDLVDVQIAEKSTFTHIDEIIVTGTRVTSWSYSAILNFLAMMESMGDGTLVSDEEDPEIPDRWKVKPPTTPTGGVQVDRNGLTIPDNEDTKEQEEMETLLGDLWTVMMRAGSDDLTVEWGSEYNENTGQYHVYPLPPLVG